MNDGNVQLLDQFGKPFSATDTAHFAASRVARELRDWIPSLESADAELSGEASTIAARSYDLERNNGIAGGAIRTNVDNIVGTGLRLAAKPDYRALGKSKKWADEWARNTEAKWRTFSESLEFDAARQLNFGGMTVMQLRTAFLSGDALALALWLPDRPGAKWATAIQSIDPARLCSASHLNSSTMRDGIKVNEYGEAIAYSIRKSHPGDMYQQGYDSSFELVPARTEFGRRKVLHLYEKLRAGQSRGKAILTNVMGAFKMLDHYQRIELQTSVVNSMIAAFIETPMRGEDIADLFGDSKSYMKERNKSGFDVKLEGAGVIPLFPGDKMTAFTPTRPNSAYAAFVEAVLRYISTGLNMPYELLMKDFSKTNYSSARAALLEAWRFFMARREWLSTYWCDPIYELWLEEAIQRGEVEAPDFYENRTSYCRCQWIGPGRGWVDPVKEADAAETRMRISVSTLERECAEQGLDWEEVLEQRARERERGIELGLDDVHAPPAQGGAPNMQPKKYPSDEEAPRDESAENSEDDEQADKQGGKLPRAQAKPAANSSKSTSSSGLDVAEFRSQVDAYGVGVRAGVITPQKTDEEYFRQKANLPEPSQDIESVWDREPVRRPVTLAAPASPKPPQNPEVQE